MRRKDRGNKGTNKRGCVDLLQDLHPEKTRSQLLRSFDRNVRPKHKHLLTGIVKAQGSTEKRSGITIQRQYRWHSTVDLAMKFVREQNTGLTPDGKSFGEVRTAFPFPPRANTSSPGMQFFLFTLLECTFVHT